MAMICTNVLALPPGLAEITPLRITANRNTVTPISRMRMTMVTHQASSPSIESPINAEQVSALSAIGSAILPKSVTCPRLRAMWPSYRSVIAATAKIPLAIHRHVVLCPPSANSASRNTGTRISRDTVSALGRFTSDTPRRSVTGSPGHRGLERLRDEIDAVRTDDATAHQL